MRKRKIRQRAVPSTLWRIYNTRARTLSQTVTSLLSQSSSHYNAALSHDALSFLVRPRDPRAFKTLLAKCFVVVDRNAPAFPVFRPHCRWSQHQIVARTIEMMLCEQKESSNVLFNGYDEVKGSSSNVDLLTSSAWCFLLNRVGDAVMVYLLKYTSIFLPIPRKSHQQVTGYPITKLCYKLPRHSVEIQHQQPFQGHGPQKKRKRVHSVSVLDRRQSNCSLNGDVPSKFVGGLGCSYAGNLKTNTKHHTEEFSLESASEKASASRTITIDAKADLNGRFHTSSNQDITRTKKHPRPYKWQRDRKCRRVISSTTSNGNGNLTERLPYDLNSSLSLEKKVPLKCSCCWMLPSPDPPVKRVQINRKPMFYSLEHCSSVFPRTNILNGLMPNSSSAKFLFENIFGESTVTGSIESDVDSANLCLIGSACVYHSILKLIKILIRRVLCCDFIKLLDKHCSVTLSDSHCSKNQVVSFIWAACRSIVPAEMLGNTRNRRTLRRNIYKFIRLRRFEKFSVKQCLHNLKTSGFPFLSNKHSFCYGKDQILTKGNEFTTRNHNADIMSSRLLEKWVFWLFSFLIVSFVQVNFYVTESQHGKQAVVYFRKSVWEKITNQAMSQLKDESYHQLDGAAVRNILGRRSFGFSKLRFLPKQKGVRMLGNLTAASRLPLQLSSFDGNRSLLQRKGHSHVRTVKYKYYKSVNSVLREAHAVLNGLRYREPEKLGSSVFDYNDVYRKYCPFLVGLKDIFQSLNVYIVVADVSKAFDSVNQDKLYNIMKDVLGRNEYVLEQSLKVVKRKKSMWVDSKLNLYDENVSTRFPSHTSLVPSSSSDSILVDQVKSTYVKREELLFVLYEHIKRNVLKFGKTLYLQGIGIAQGSILSPLLCALYYGDLDRNIIFPFIDRTRGSSCTLPSNHVVSTKLKSNRDELLSNPDHLLLRFTDDILFISTSKKQATSFFHRLQRGFMNYNCYMNKEKFGLNFDIGNIEGLLTDRIFVGDDGISFLQWSGLLINCCTLEVQPDYTRYSSKHIHSTLIVRWLDKPGHTLKEKLYAFMRPKCHAIFFDSKINSAAVVRLNIYQAFLLCAMKFHCYFRDLSCVCKLSKGYYLHTIKKSLRYMHVLINKRMRSVIFNGYCPVLQLEDGEVEWLGLTAYVQVLKRKQTRHKDLLSLLRSELGAHRLTGMVSPPLKYATEIIHSSSIWKIKY